MNIRTVGLIIVLALVLAALYAGFRHSGTSGGTGPPQALTFRLAILENRVASGPTLLAARQGDAVTLIVTSDHAGEVHIHGYYQTAALEPGRDAALSFTADRAGRFDVELHGEHDGHVDIAALEVQPR